MKKIMFVLLAAIMFSSMFVYVKQAKALSNGMTLDPVELVYNPPYGGPNDFYWNLTITTTDNVAGWEATLLWDAAVVRVLDATYGDFMTGYPVTGVPAVIGSSGNQIQLGQYFTAPGTVSGSGWLATIHFTFVLPGYTQMYFLEAKVWDDSTPKNEYNLLPPLGDTEMYCHVLSDLPHPAFRWYTDDGINPCPKHACYDQGRTTYSGTPVHFNGSSSYDVGDVYWDGVTHTWAKTVNYPDIVEWIWDFNDGYYSNDIRLYHGTLPRGVIIRLGDPDIGRALVAFKSYEKHDKTVVADGFYDGIGAGPAPAWEGVYNDTDLSGNVTMGDFRYVTPSIFWPALASCVPVAPIDPDFGNALVAFKADEKHTDGIMSEPGSSEVVVPGYINGLYDNWEPIYRDRQYKDTIWTDPGYGIVNCGAVTWDHEFSAYNKSGWVVELTVYDSEGEYWSTNWRYQGPAPSNTVPMWRDLAIVDIWASLPPYQNWEEYDDDWGNYWFFDSSDFWLPNVADPYWNYKVDFPSYGYPAGTTVKSAWNTYGSEGLYVLVTGNNFGSVPEKATINLYAFYLEQHVKVGNPPLAVFNIGVEKIGTWTRVINKGAGTGWNCYTVWMPPKNGTYLLFATIQPADDTQVHDMDHSNDYFLLSKPICNIAKWDFVGLTLLTNSIFTQFTCDLSRNGKVGPEDFALISSNFGKLPPS